MEKIPGAAILIIAAIIYLALLKLERLYWDIKTKKISKINRINLLREHVKKRAINKEP